MKSSRREWPGLLLVFALVMALPVSAATLGRPFSDGMVLQRDCEVPVWGQTTPGTEVSVSFAGRTVMVKADAQGAWHALLGPFPASKEGRVLAVSDSGGKAEIRDVVIGEVWLCSGQSNMDMAIADDTPRYGDGIGRMVAQVTDKPFVRYLNCGGGGWHALTPKFLFQGRKSALAVHWGLELYEKLDVPVGLAVAAVGGSNIDSWIPANGEKANLHNWLVRAFAPYGIRGVIWYQGESNVHEGELYTQKLHRLYDGWSEAFRAPGVPDWKAPPLRFYYVQIAPYAYGDEMGGAKEREFARFQEAQAKFATEEPNAEMTVINDLGDLRDIHPNNKWLVAKRLALHALKRDYGFLDIEDNSPTLASAAATGARVRLVFDHATSLYVHNAERSLDAAFELAGSDGVWKKARIVNFSAKQKKDWSRFGNLEDNVVELEAEGVERPVKVRHAYVSPWKGCLYNQVNLPCGTFSAELPYVARNETYRPQFHFTAPKGWINDPNGLVWKDGVWHLCYQHHPSRAGWGPMTCWGHAISTNLVHWRDQGDVIAPTGGVGCWSGSSAVDADNVAGFGTGAIVSMFTGNGQELAWSLDGRTWNRYEGNPALAPLACEHRDPMVFYHRPSGKWVMVLFVEEEGHTNVAFLNSPDLRKWTRVSTVKGDPVSKPPRGVWGRERDWLFECPNFVEMPVAGTQERRWVLFDASGNYAVGAFDGERFTIEEGPFESLPTRDKTYYAAQTFANAPDGRCVGIAWYHVNIPGGVFTQLMSVPYDFLLVRTGKGLRLARRPVRELEVLRDGPARKLEEVEGDCFEILLDCQVAKNAAAAFDLRGEEVVYDAVKGTLSAGGATIPWTLEGGRFRARVFIDRVGFEIFSADGLTTFPRGIICDPKKRSLAARPADGVSDSRHCAWPMKSMYAE